MILKPDVSQGLGRLLMVSLELGKLNFGRSNETQIVECMILQKPRYRRCLIKGNSSSVSRNSGGPVDTNGNKDGYGKVASRGTKRGFYHRGEGVLNVTMKVMR